MPQQRPYARTAPLLALLALACALVAVAAPTATAASKRRHVMGPALGIAWDIAGKGASRHQLKPTRRTHRVVRSRFGHALRTLVPLAVCPDPTCNMTYHSGSLVLGPHTTHVVYWQPSGFSVTANYHSLIERFFTDVAADSGRVTNVYATDTQYSDSGSNFIQYQQTFAGSLTDTNAFPATQSGCPTSDGAGRTVAVCLTQTQEANELDSFIQANSLPRGLNNIYFLVLPDNVETCVDDFSSCGNILNTTPNRYCAYHSFFNISGHGETLWANQPYIGFADNHCGSGDASKRPNGDVTDHELNVLSHEHNETITDPDNGGWFDTNGTGENGDKCNFDFGTKIASNANGNYNQLINHHPYELQLEWDNSITGCSANFGALAPTALFGFTPGSPKALDPVSFDGSASHSNNAGGYIVDWQWTFGDGSSGSGATPSHTYAAAGTYTVTLKVEDDAGLTSTVSQTVTVALRPTTTTYTGATSGDYHDAVTLGGSLVDAATAAPLAGRTLTFSLGSQSCSGTTDALGLASCVVTLTQTPGSYTVTAAYAGDGTVYVGSSDARPFTIAREESTLTYSGPTVVAAGSSLTVSATLAEDGANDNDADPGAVPPSPAGQSVTFTLDGQSCTGTTDASGAVSCTIASVSGSTLGSKTVTASFAGDAYYLPSVDSAAVVVFAFPSSGAFVLGDLSVAAALPGTTLDWWGSQWSGDNGLSGGAAPLAFKGFADDVVTLPTGSPAATCGTAFTTRPGNSSAPPSSVPAYMGVLVASSVSKSGSTVGGRWAKIVVVRTDPGYAANPGHPGTGTVVATFCG